MNSKIKIQKSKSTQKTSICKTLKNKNIKKQIKNNLENTFNNKVNNASLKKRNNIKSNIKKEEEENYKSLINAIELNNSQTVENLLKNTLFNINKLNENGFSPLHLSIIKGNIKIINLLIKYGAKINILSSKNKQTPLHLAYINNNDYSKNIIELLLNNGANNNILDINNKKPSDYKPNIKDNTSAKDNVRIYLQNKINNIINQTKKINNEKKGIKNNITNNIKKEKKEKKETKKTEYKGNTYTLRDSKDNSLVVITMDNISYLTSDENTIFQKSDTNTKNNSEILNEISRNNENNKNNIKNNHNFFKDSLDVDEENTLETKKIKYYSNYFFEKSELVDSLEISHDKYKNQNYINNKDKTPNEYDNNTKDNSKDNYSNNYIQNNPSKNLDDVFKSLIRNKRYSYFKLVKNNTSHKNDNNLNSTKTKRNTCSSHYDNTDNSINKMNNNNSIENTYDKKNNTKTESKNNEFNFSNIYRNRNSLNSMISTISQTNKKKNYKKAQSFTKENEIKMNFSQINKDCSYLLNWLLNLQLSSYYKNFLDNEIYDINRLVNQMKSIDNKLNYENIESLLLIHKPGHIYRILTQLEVDAGIIDKNVANFMINNKDYSENSYVGKTLLFSDKYNCKNCCNYLDIEICGGKNEKKNDLKSFLKRYNLLFLYQNFCHNGFELINYVILQMYGNNPINSDILENCFHIYDENNRKLVMKSLEKEVSKIKNFLSSEKYYENDYSSFIKYDRVVFDKDTNIGNTTEIKINNKNECCIF